MEINGRFKLDKLCHILPTRFFQLSQPDCYLERLHHGLLPPLLDESNKKNEEINFTKVVPQVGLRRRLGLNFKATSCWLRTSGHGIMVGNDELSFCGKWGKISVKNWGDFETSARALN